MISQIAKLLSEDKTHEEIAAQLHIHLSLVEQLAGTQLMGTAVKMYKDSNKPIE